MPEANYICPASFNYQISDGLGGAAEGTANVTVYSARNASSNGSSSYFKENGYNAYAAFDIKYLNGAVSPTGSMTFTSSQYWKKIVGTGIDTLSVSGKTATITGTCTVNGINGYRFTINVTDNATPGSGADTFGITVTGPNGFNYSASGTIISGDYTVSK